MASHGAMCLTVGEWSMDGASRWRVHEIRRFQVKVRPTPQAADSRDVVGAKDRGNRRCRASREQESGVLELVKTQVKARQPGIADRCRSRAFVGYTERLGRSLAEGRKTGKRRGERRLKSASGSTS